MKTKIKKSAKEFSNEFKKSLNTGIVAAFGFLIALIWKEVIVDFVEKISYASPIKGKLISALIVTLICALGIYISSKIFSSQK